MLDGRRSRPSYNMSKAPCRSPARLPNAKSLGFFQGSFFSKV